MKKYSASTEEKMIKYYSSLQEIDKRRYAGLESEKLGRGGKTYIRKLLGCDYKTIKRGIDDLSKDMVDNFGYSRKEGGGRKLKMDDGLTDETFMKIISGHTAGSPSEDGAKWTYLNQSQIADAMRENNIDVSRFVVKQLLLKHGYVKRKSQKKSPWANGQQERTI